MFHPFLADLKKRLSLGDILLALLTFQSPPPRGIMNKTTYCPDEVFKDAFI